MTSAACPLLLPDDFVALIEAECGSASYAGRLLEVFRRSCSDVPSTALALISASWGQCGESWRERCLAVLLLEHLLLRLAPDQLGEFDFILTMLGLKPETGDDVPMQAVVLEQGFSTRNFRGFVGELVRRLGRLDRVHHALRQADCGRAAWEYFLRTARDVSKLTLARYVFSPDEVIQEIERTLLVTGGAENALSRLRHRPSTPVTQESLKAPRYETEIVRRLCDGHRIYWVSARCGSELNAMVEYPLASAVVVIKPPGSDREIEIKRAGTRGPRLLNVIWERNGVVAPISHRLFGGSLGWLARRETVAAGIFSKIFRLVHGSESPCSQGVSHSSIVDVPTSDGPVHALDYLTNRHHFGPGFDAMRDALGACADSFPADSGLARASYQGERGRTLQFIGQASPEQAVICGSSSFRLDRITLYLSDTGPEKYFQEGLGRLPVRSELRWLADSVLEEILGEVVAPPEGYLDHPQYLRDAFRVGDNRRRADRNYLSAMRQIGECWGTLLAVRGFSDGESFVQRNVGLKSVWRDGDWQVRVIFQDHDDLTVAGSGSRHVSPWREVSGMQQDRVHILGGPSGGETIPGEAGALKAIYRVGPDIGDAGLKSLEAATAAAYDRTQAALAVNHELQDLFYPGFIKGRRDYYELVSGFLQTDPGDLDSWKRQADAYLRAEGYGEELMATYTSSIYHFRGFFEQMRFLYSR
jgi:hypothetical protein